MGANAFYIFIGFVAVAAVIIGRWVKWDMPGADDEGSRLDPSQITRRMLDDPDLSDEERQYLIEMAALELPRRHLIC
ncbi:MAG: hypothetical protein HQ503_19270 [Rhodospirillales bacterium]|nr:hypothetical protein [Rhodospirillales bacterium]